MAYPLSHMKGAMHMFLESNSLDKISGLLGYPAMQLLALNHGTAYRKFEIAKKAGGVRQIETPADPLKEVQRLVAFYIQSVYYFHKPSCSYGYILQPRKENNPRNILTNARAHLGCRSMLNIDLNDFFHQFTFDSVIRIFTGPPFCFSYAVAYLLSKITTYNGRLPMGGPASPSLSNWGMIDLDLALMENCRQQHITYSRFADDMTFSTHQQFPECFLDKLTQLLDRYKFIINEKKTKWMGEEDPKEVTGLLLNENRIALSREFLTDLASNLTRLRHYRELRKGVVQGLNAKEMERFQHHLSGKLRFVRLIYGSQNGLYRKLERMWNEAMSTTPFLETYNWSDIPYYFKN